MTAATLIHWAVALSPVVILKFLFAWLDPMKLMTRWELLGALLLGVIAGLASYPISGVFLDAMPLGFSDYSRFVAPFIEEALKLIVVIALFAANRVGSKSDAAIQGFAVGAGFAVVENVIYLQRFSDLTTATWLVRGLGTAVMHGGTVAVMTALAQELSERAVQDRPAAAWRINPLWFAPGYAAAVLIHGAFNQFPDAPLLAMLAAAILVPAAMFAIFQCGLAETRAQLHADHAEHRHELTAYAAGGFPDTSAGRRLADFVAAYDGGTRRAALTEYVALTTALVLRAEETLIRQADSDRRVTAAGAAADFARLAVLRRACGRPALRALRPLLPFSRNDLWELSELRERAGR